MDFDLTDEQKAIQALCREFARDEVARAPRRSIAKAEFPYDLVKKMAELGLMGLPFPEEYGGSGGDTVSYALAVMEIARADASTAITMAAHVSLGAMPVLSLRHRRAETALPRAAGARRRCSGASA